MDTETEQVVAAAAETAAVEAAVAADAAVEAASAAVEATAGGGEGEGTARVADALESLEDRLEDDRHQTILLRLGEVEDCVNRLSEHIDSAVESALRSYLMIADDMVETVTNTLEAEVEAEDTFTAEVEAEDTFTAEVEADATAEAETMEANNDVAPSSEHWLHRPLLRFGR